MEFDDSYYDENEVPDFDDDEEEDHEERDF
jgi:hypothetical protein